MSTIVSAFLIVLSAALLLVVGLPVPPYRTTLGTLLLPSAQAFVGRWRTTTKRVEIVTPAQPVGGSVLEEGPDAAVEQLRATATSPRSPQMQVTRVGIVPPGSDVMELRVISLALGVALAVLAAVLALAGRAPWSAPPTVELTSADETAL
jgi:hypothetical protein